MAETTVIAEGKIIATTTGECYELLKNLGVGGMGSVWKARQPSLDRLVAIKLLLNSAYTAKALERLRREAIALGSISHENIVKLLAVQTSNDGKPFLVLELVEGHTLEQELKNSDGRLSPSKFKLIFSAVLNALEHAHAAGFIHRDLKPQNILIANDSTVKVTDFGITKALEENRFQSVTQTGHLVGTPSYMSPEQWASEQVTPASDIYSLGCLMYETLTGRQLFTGSSPFEIAHKHSSESPALEDESLDPNLSRILQKCLAKNAGDRFQSVGELKAELEACDYGQISAPGPFIIRTARKSHSLKQGPLLMAMATVTLGAAFYLSLGHSPKSSQIAERQTKNVVTLIIEGRQISDQAILATFNEDSTDAVKVRAKEMVAELEKRIEIEDQPIPSISSRMLRDLYAMKGLLTSYVQPEKAVDAYKKAISISKRAKDSQPLFLDCIALANLYRARHDYQNTEKYYEMAEQVCHRNENPNTPSVQSITLDIQRSQLCTDQHDPEKAYVLAQRAVDACIKSGMPPPSVVAQAKYEVVHDLVDAGRLKEASTKGNTYAKEIEEDIPDDTDRDAKELGMYYAGVQTALIKAAIKANDLPGAERTWKLFEAKMGTRRAYRVGTLSLPALLLARAYAEKDDRAKATLWFNRTLEYAVKSKTISDEQSNGFKSEFKNCDPIQNRAKWQSAVNAIADRLSKAINVWTI